MGLTYAGVYAPSAWNCACAEISARQIQGTWVSYLVSETAGTEPQKDQGYGVLQPALTAHVGTVFQSVRNRRVRKLETHRSALDQSLAQFIGDGFCCLH